MLLNILLLAVAAVAAPLQKRALSADDQAVLDLALYLEHLEFALYSGGCNDFTDDEYTAAGFPTGFRESICIIAQQEATHIAIISSILLANGATANPAYTYKFSYTDPTSFVNLASFITNTGIGTYLGGSELLTNNAILEEVAASILTVEARHDTFLRMGNGLSPFPTAFDTGLTALWAFSHAQNFIVSCPVQLPIVHLPRLNITVGVDLDAPVTAGAIGEFSWDPSTLFVDLDPTTPLYIAIVNQNISAPIFQPLHRTSLSSGTATLPDGVNGTAFGCLTTFAGGLDLAALSSYGTLAGPVEVILS